MKLLSILFLSLLLTGCVSVPIQRKFPDVSPILLEPCNPPKAHPQSDKLSEHVVVITENYGELHKCSAKQKGWIDWYNEQKKIFEEAMK